MAAISPTAFVAFSRGVAPHSSYVLPCHATAKSTEQAQLLSLTTTAVRNHGHHQWVFWTDVVACAALQRGMKARRTCASKRARYPLQKGFSVWACMSERFPTSLGATGATLPGRVIQTDSTSASTFAQLNSMRGMHSLTAEDIMQLEKGLMVQKQQRHGGQGNGCVVFEVNAPPSVVLSSLSRFEDYTHMIPVVRQAQVQSRQSPMDGSVMARVSYKISKFWLSLSASHVCDVDAGVVRFDLDQGSSMFLREASGSWQVEQLSGKHGDRSRVWLRARVRASSIVPAWIVDYAAERALRRATSWLGTYTERVWKELQVQQLWKEHSRVQSQGELVGNPLHGAGHELWPSVVLCILGR